MRQSFSFMVASVDGYYEGPNQEFDWPNVDQEFNEFALEQLDEVDTLLIRASHVSGDGNLLAAACGGEDDPQIAARMNDISKIVLLRTLDKADWAKHAAHQG